MCASGATDKQLQRFDECGRNACLYKSASTGQTAIFGSFCKNRTCVPCAVARSNLIARNLCKWLIGKETRFLTLTLVTTHEPLGDTITRIWASFKLLRKRPEWNQHVRGYAAFLESKWKEKSGGWHTHLHIIIEGTWWEHAEIRRLWHTCTGDSLIVDIQQKGTPQSRAFYGAKYASKPFDSGSISDPHVLAVAVAEFAHRRLWQIGGEWKGKLKLLDKGTDPGDWKFVAGLDFLFEQAANGIGEALELVEAIRQSIQADLPRPPPE